MQTMAAESLEARIVELRRETSSLRGEAAANAGFTIGGLGGLAVEASAWWRLIGLGIAVFAGGQFVRAVLESNHSSQTLAALEAVQAQSELSWSESRPNSFYDQDALDLA